MDMVACMLEESEASYYIYYASSYRHTIRTVLEKRGQPPNILNVNLSSSITPKKLLLLLQFTTASHLIKPCVIVF